VKSELTRQQVLLWQSTSAPQPSPSASSNNRLSSRAGLRRRVLPSPLEPGGTQVKSELTRRQVLLWQSTSAPQPSPSASSNNRLSTGAGLRRSVLPSPLEPGGTHVKSELTRRQVLLWQSTSAPQPSPSASSNNRLSTGAGLRRSVLPYPLEPGGTQVKSELTRRQVLLWQSTSAPQPSPSASSKSRR